MLVEGLVPECDYSGIKYQGNVWGAWVVAQGATGRWCSVMYIGPEYLRDNNLSNQVLTMEQAEAHVALEGGYLDL